MPVLPEAVWDVLAEPDSYGYLVAGSKAIRDAEPGWPAPGSKFHHTIGFGGLTLADHTVALESERPHRLRLRAKGRPLGTATVTLELARKDGGTLVTMSEHPDGVFGLLALNPLLQALTRVRNAESLRRLEELAVRRA